ncbi:MAG: sensor histidine kinase [Chloroflexi bacterium]|nr:sensor histidine kinase [Chloroflexota bacterium]
MNTSSKTPEYADFEDYRYTQRVVVAVRWFVIGTWAASNHWRATYNENLLMVDSIGLGIVAMNAWLYFRLRQDRPVSRFVAVSASLLDLIAISVGIAITNRFLNTFFVLYYPAMVGMALVISSRRMLVLVTSATAAAYACISIFMAPGLDIDSGDERRLTARIVVMYASVLAAHLILREERRRRRDAVWTIMQQAEENARLQTIAQRAELKAAEQRYRIGRDIHDGIAQSLYGIALNLESAADAARQGDTEAVTRKLEALVPISKQALLETRHYMHDLRPMLGQGGDLCTAVENLVTEFRNISGLSVELHVEGDRRPMAEQVAAQTCRIVQEALANILRHSRAGNVVVQLNFEDSGLTLRIIDDGSGFDSTIARAGFGLGNMRSRAADIGGTIPVQSVPGTGTTVTATIPTGPTNPASQTGGTPNATG